MLPRRGRQAWRARVCFSLACGLRALEAEPASQGAGTPLNLANTVHIQVSGAGKTPVSISFNASPCPPPKPVENPQSHPIADRGYVLTFQPSGNRTTKKTHLGAGSMPHLVECLPSMQEALCSSSLARHKAGVHSSL